MKCSLVRDTILRQIDGDIFPATTLKAIDAHVEDCPACQGWRAFHRALVEGSAETDLPTFQLSPAVKGAIRNTVPPARSKFWQLPIPLRAGIVAFAALVLLFGVFRYTSLQPSETLRIEPLRINGQNYRVLWLDANAPFSPADLELPTVPALQPEHEAGKGRIRQQLGFLTADLASALRESLKSPNWKKVRDALAAQEMELPNVAPKHLILSEPLIELLQKEPPEVELWVIQPKTSVLLFTIAQKIE
jgi:hypothetical protein